MTTTRTIPKAVRSPQEPIIVPRIENTYWWERNGIFNAGVTEYKGQIILIYRAYDDYRVSRLGLANSKDGVYFTLHEHPIIDTNPSDEFERIGIEDPRVTKIDDTYYIIHTSASYKKIGEVSDVSLHDYIPWRVRTGMHTTKDFHTFIHHGVILPDIPAKNASLLPEKRGGAFVLYYREFTEQGEVLKIAFTKDFTSWFGGKTIPWPIQEDWTGLKFGLGSQPIALPQGYLIVSHGVDLSGAYRLGLMMFDNHDPSHMLWHAGPILEPEMPYEKEGFVPNVVYTCGAILRDEEIWIYYGGADKVIGRAILPLAAIR